MISILKYKIGKWLDYDMPMNIACQEKTALRWTKEEGRKKGKQSTTQKQVM
uniref:Uncharacterized protein n=1 Tax=Arion vulgaris TaxID=1028688 RepID=A0A0B6YIU8_9EUPU